MDYRNRESVEATTKSYMEAFGELVKICPNIEPSANECNGRTVLPIHWRPIFGYRREELLGRCNTVKTRHEPLFGFGQPKIVLPQHTIWRTGFFGVYCAIELPFNIYAWECAKQVCEGGFDEEGNCIGGYKNVPAQMKEWCSPQHLTLEVYDGIWSVTWGLGQWHEKRDEIAEFGLRFEDRDARKQYNKGIARANEEVSKWERAIKELGNICIPSN